MRFHHAYLAISISLFVGCSVSKQAEVPPPVKAKIEVPPKPEAPPEKLHVHWSYEGAGAPANWGSLNPDFKLCSNGKNQSPIDISETPSLPMVDMTFSYKPSDYVLVNNGHAIQADFKEGNSFNTGTTKYQLLQFHFHTPSEHTVSGKHFPMEIHFVHKDAEGKLAVIGVLFEEGKSNQALSNLFKHIPQKSGEKHVMTQKIDLAKILPEQKSYTEYSGSLTTPPCTEGVRWIVLKQSIQASSDELAAIKKVIGNNSRPVQNLNDRIVISATN